MASDALHLQKAGCGCTAPRARAERPRSLLLLALALAASAACAGNAQTAGTRPQAAIPTQPLPEAPAPQNPAHGVPVLAAHPAQAKKPTQAERAVDRCEVKNAGATMAATGGVRALAALGLGGAPSGRDNTAVETLVCVPHIPIINWYARFITGPEVKPLTPEGKARLAGRNLIDPFNLITILGEAGISVAADSHSAYGPGMSGWGRYVGVSFTEDMTGEFFGTFVIPSLVHQDPHYHRRPDLSIKRRVWHCIEQVAWTQGDNGRDMVNYADLGGFAIDGAISNLYVPGQQTHFSADATRYAIGLATAPIDNFITEFLPDIASHIHVRVVLVQRIINQVAQSRTETSP